MKGFIFRSRPLLLLLVLAIPAFGGESLALPRLPVPVEAPADPQLRAFLSELHKAVWQRDANALKNLMASDIKLTFGPPPEAPPEEFLQLSNPNSPVWTELQTMLELGGAYPTPSRDHYCIPYTYAAFPDDLDAYNHQVVIGPSVARAEPNANAAILAKLDHVIVRTDYGTPTIIKEDDGKAWAKIYLNGQTAYVPADQLLSPIGYRACFGKRNSHWAITHLLAGD